MRTIILNNSVTMPMVGLGVFQMTPEQTEKVVLEALQAGYRLIDTAQSYGNEEAVGRAIKASGIPRDEIFITTKLWIQRHGYLGTEQAFAQSLDKLGLDYIDLYLIHQPIGDVFGEWRAMESLYKTGQI